MRTQVAIVGAGPAGMFLAHLLHAAGIGCVVLERRDRAFVEGRVRAGVLEPITVALLRQLGLSQGLDRDGLAHDGVNLSIAGDLFRIPLASLVGTGVTVYGQQEVMRDLFDGAAERGIKIVWQADRVALEGFDGTQPSVVWWQGEARQRLECDFIAGCDGFHGVCRGSLPTAAFRTYERVYPFGWLGILADVPPCNDELIYANHERGFALASMRSEKRSRYYVQVALDERIEDWPDDRFWDELCLRLGAQAAATLTRGPSFEKSIAPLRSFVTEPMCRGRLFLAGDAAHIVPPTGAKGMNLAVSDVLMLADGLIGHYRGSEDGLKAYSRDALSRVWKAERFSWWLTAITHRFPDADPFSQQMQLAELSYLRGSETAQRSFAENYVGLPMEGGGRWADADKTPSSWSKHNVKRAQAAPG